MSPHDSTNPFPGLRFFGIDDTTLFFGREGQSDELLRKLRETRFVAVVGTSGSGKSSLIYAGLLPALYSGLMRSGRGSQWRVALFRPGNDPIRSLARALNSAGQLPSEAENDADMQAMFTEVTLRRSSLGLVEYARRLGTNPPENLLVVVDQFEELFRFRTARSGPGDEAAAFVKLLLEAADQRDSHVYVVLTMRSDFLGDCAQFHGLIEAINPGQYLIPRLTRDDRSMAITGPIAVGGGQITQRLVNRLLNDMGDSPDQLPIMQHALMRTWEHWTRQPTDRPLDLPDYEAIGGMNKALSLHGDEAFNELADERSRMLAEKIFKALTEKDANNYLYRRPAPLREVCEIVAASQEEVSSVIETFRCEGRSFLMPPVPVLLNEATIIDISHESLIRNWERLRTWVDEEAQSSRVYRRLAEATVLHRKGMEGLMSDPSLQIALDWRQQQQPNRAWAIRYHPEFDAAMDFLEASRAAQEQQRQEATARDRRELERARAFAEVQGLAARRLRLLTIAMALLLVLAIAMATYAVKLRNDAVRASASAVKALEMARQNESAATAATQEADKQRSIALAAMRDLELANAHAQLLLRKLPSKKR